MGGLAKGLAVIRAFTRDHSALTLSEVAAIARMPAATARRCLLTLYELGYVTRGGRQFLLRPMVLELGAAYLESMDIEHLTKTHLESWLHGRQAALLDVTLSTSHFGAQRCEARRQRFPATSPRWAGSCSRDSPLSGSMPIFVPSSSSR
jgi:DNA-binding IclR family transcriptional regulator